MAAGVDKGASTKGDLVTGQQMQLISMDRGRCRQGATTVEGNSCMQLYHILYSANNVIYCKKIIKINVPRMGGQKSNFLKIPKHL